MSDPTTPGDQNPDATPTEALQLADQQPVEPPPAPAAPTAATSQPRSHTRTILEVVGGVVAAGLIVVAGAVGFFVGHATGSDHDGDRFASSREGGQYGPQADGQGYGRQGQGQGQQGMPMMSDQDPRGIDPDGDDWTGQGGHGWGDDDGDGHMGGMSDDQGMPMMPGFGEDQAQPTVPQG